MSGQMHAKRGIAATIADIDAASEEAGLVAGIEQARLAVIAELRAHTPTLTLAAAWSEVLRHSVASATRLVAGDASLGWTWVVSGSVGRGEAIPGSDVETLMVVDDEVDDAGKTDLMARAADVHAVMERCGLLPDPNGVLASRGRFCRRRASWAESAERWCATPAEDRGVVMAGLLVDSADVLDPTGGGVELRSQTIEAALQHPAVLRAMLQDATSSRAGIPSRLRVFASQSDTVDLKAAAVDPIVKIARWGALSAGSQATATLDRLIDAAGAKILDIDDASTLKDCYLSLSRIRWRTRAGSWIDTGRVSEDVSLSELAPQERAALRTVGHEVSGIRRKLNFLASTSSSFG